MRIAIIQGASNDIGKETAIGMAERGAKVIMACRDVTEGEMVRSMIVKKTKNPNVKVMHLDLASFKSIRKFAKTFLKEEERLDILINNESVMGIGRTLTEDGLEMHMGVNHFGHFLLTVLLIGRLQKSTPSRIITVSHWGNLWVRFNKDDVNSEKSYNRFNAFFQSKLANVLFTVELAERLAGSGISINSVHPGFFRSDTGSGSGSLMTTMWRGICDIFSAIFLRTAKSGAQNTLFAALDFNMEYTSGVFLSNFRFSPTNPDANNSELRSWFWDYSEKVTGIEFPKNTWIPDEYNLNARKKREAILNQRGVY
ncbi:hypothetical protein HA402_005284 [Bradysia odoriphaga]|nr:hypothetical protein HA402_005284 [Bradysia odoriphaga]